MESLYTRVKRSGRLPPMDAAGWALRLCKRIGELHRLGVAHGGLSPHVILTTGVDCQSRGVFGDVREAATRPAFHSPERLAGGGISTADDCWGVACSLFFLATGQVPFAGVTSQEIAASVERLGVPSLRTYGLEHPGLEAIVHSFLQGDPAQRATGLVELQRELEGVVPADVVLAPLEEGEEESHHDFDDEDEEDAATVMRDFSDVRAQILAMQKGTGMPDPTGGEPAAKPIPRPAPPRPAPAGNLAPPPAPPPEGSLPLPFDDDEDEDDGATQLLDTDGLYEEGLEAAIAARGDPTGASPPSPGPGFPPSPPASPSGVSQSPSPSTGPFGAGGLSGSGGASLPGSGLPATGRHPGAGAGPAGGAAGPAAGAMGSAGGAMGSAMGSAGAAMGVGAGQAVPGVGAPGVGSSAPGLQGASSGATMAPQEESSGLKIALVIATILLLIVMTWVGMLLLERFGYVTLPV